MADIEIKCPKCGREFLTDEDSIGLVGQCDRCGAEFKVTSPGRTAVEPSMTRSANQDVTFPSGGALAAETPAQTVLAETGEGKTMPAAEAEVGAEWKVGDVILDTYEVKKISEESDYAEGGMGRVYRVHHRRWNMDLAVKSPKPDYFQTETQKENFTFECETWINLGLHPHIVSCYYVRTLGGIPRIFAEYVQGGSLKDWIDNRKLYGGGPQEALKRILDVAIQFAWGLQYAHAKGLIHQDVKPANVLMMPDGIAKVTDFGLAKARAAAGEAPRSDKQRNILVSSVGMTPAYCSPEQADKQPLSPKTDIWSWGLSVLEMFAGGVTWMAGQAAPDAFEAILASDAKDVCIPEMPRAVADLLRNCFRPQPADRPRDMAAVSRTLKEIYKQAAGHSHPLDEPKGADLLADSLNNQAVSMLELSRQSEAEKLLNSAYLHESTHPEVTYNRGLLLWRQGRLTDAALLQQLEQCQIHHANDWTPYWLTGLVQIERGDFESAEHILAKAAGLGGHAEIVETSHIVDSLKGDSHRRLKSVADELKAADMWYLSITADAHWGLSGGRSGELQLWDLHAGKVLRTIKGPAKSVLSVALSAEAKAGLSMHEDGAWVWDLAIGTSVRFLGADSSGHAVGMSADGRWGVTSGGGPRKSLRLWNLRSGACVRTFGSRTGLSSAAGDLMNFDYDTAIGVTPDARFALVGSKDGTLRLYNLGTGRCLRTIEPYEQHADWISSVALCPNARWALSASRDGLIRLTDLVNGRCVRTFAKQDGILCVAISPDSKWALAYGRDFQLRRTAPSWKAPNIPVRPRSYSQAQQHARAFQEKMAGARDAIAQGQPQKALALANDARQLPEYSQAGEAVEISCQAGASGIVTGLVTAWQSSLAAKEPTGEVYAVAISADGLSGLSGSQDGFVRLWDFRTKKSCHVFHSGQPVWALAMTGRGSSCLIGGGGGALCMHDWTTNRPRWIVDGHKGGIRCVCVSQDNAYGMSAGDDNLVRLWDLSDGHCIRTFSGHTSMVGTVAMLPDLRTALSSSGDGTIRVWDLLSGECIRSLHCYAHCLALGPDGRWFLVGESGSIGRWDVATGARMTIIGGHPGTILSLGVSADGRWAISGSEDHKVRLWDLEGASCVHTFEGYQAPVVSLALSANRARALSGSYDRTLGLIEFIWDYDFPPVQEWDSRAQPYLEAFLARHALSPGKSETQGIQPSWKNEEFEELLREFRYRGYGWLTPEGVKRQLTKLASTWAGPPSLPRRDEPAQPSGGMRFQSPEPPQAQASVSPPIFLLHRCMRCQTEMESPPITNDHAENCPSPSCGASQRVLGVPESLLKDPEPGCDLMILAEKFPEKPDLAERELNALIEQCIKKVTDAVKLRFRNRMASGRFTSVNAKKRQVWFRWAVKDRSAFEEVKKATIELWRSATTDEALDSELSQLRASAGSPGSKRKDNWPDLILFLVDRRPPCGDDIFMVRGIKALFPAAVSVSLNVKLLVTTDFRNEIYIAQAAMLEAARTGFQADMHKLTFSSFSTADGVNATSVCVYRKA